MSKSSIYINVSITDSGELSFCELRAKEVVNSSDGRRLGRIIDIIFTADGGAVCGIIVPYNRKAVLFKSRDVFIPWECIRKIGEDVIIVELPDFCGKPAKKKEPIRCAPPKPDCPPPPSKHDCPPPKPCQEPCDDGPQCDRRCEKCMLFDCQHRWSEQTKSGCGSGHSDKNYY